MSEPFKDRVAVVTGGGAGIGRALAHALAAEGARVVVADVRADAAETVAGELGHRGGQALAVPCDVSERGSVESLAERVHAELGDVHLLFANAGVGVAGQVADVAEKNWRWVLAVNVEGTLHTIQAFVPRMKQAGPGARVVLTASLAGFQSPEMPGLGIYAMTKHSVVALGEALRADLADEDLSVSLLCPGLVRTRIWNGAEARPERFGGPVSLPEHVGEPWLAGLDPENVARGALEGIRRGEFYILVPQSERRVNLEARFREILDALEES